MVFSGGGRLTRRPHLLSHDGKHVLVCAETNIRVYSTTTAELLFEMQGHTDEVTGLALHPRSTTKVKIGTMPNLLAPSYCFCSVSSPLHCVQCNALPNAHSMMHF